MNASKSPGGRRVVTWTGCPPNPATLAAWLRTRSDEQIGALLVARPDVARPAPSDVVALASRLAVPVSVDRALDELDAATLQVLDVVLLEPADGVPAGGLLRPCPGLPGDVVAAAIGTLTTRALLWGDDALRAPDPVRRAVRHPAGLGRPATELRLQLPRDLRAALAELSPEEREVLDRLAGGRPVGHLPDGPADGARTPARRLLQRGLLARIDALNVELPRELGLLLRGDAPYGPPRLRPEPATVPRPVATLERQAAGAALESVGRVGELLTLLEEEPAGLLRSGGVGVRDQKRLARELHVGEPEAAWLLELAYAAGLLDVGGPHRDEWLPTRGYDIWREQDLPDRWAVLAAGWLGGVRLPSLVGQRDVARQGGEPAVPRPGPPHRAGDPPVGARRARRVPGRVRAGARRPGRAAALAHAPAGRPAGAGPRHAGRGGPARRSWSAACCPPPAAGCWLHGEDGAADGMRGLLPEPVDHVLAQPDLSLIAPGPLVCDLADTLAVVADVESSGGATVFRVSEASIRRALDAGWSAADLHDFFTRASRTPVPQALDYLVDDVARQHGRLRVGAIESYVRSDDHGLLSQVLNDKRSAGAELRRLAPGVLVSGARRGRGAHGAARRRATPPPGENPGGAVLTRPPARPRAAGRRTGQRARSRPPGR